MPKLGSMLSDRHSLDGSYHKHFDAFRLSRFPVKIVRQKLRKQNHKCQGNEEEIARGILLGCLISHGRGGGCKVGADMGEDFEDTSCRKSSTTKETKEYNTMCGAGETRVDCFSSGRKEKLWRINRNRDLELDDMQRNSRTILSLPDDILELCLMKLPLTSLMSARLVCKKWNYLTATSRFMHTRRECLYQTPWLFLFGSVKDGYCSGEIHALDVSLDCWHTLNAEILGGRFLFSVASLWDEIFVVGGCSSLSNFGRVDRSSFKTHKSMLVFIPSTKSWHKVASMKYARSSPVLGISEFGIDCSVILDCSRSMHDDVSEAYDDPHGISLRHEFRNASNENDSLLLPARKQYNVESYNGKDSRRFVLIAVGGRGSWDEPLDSGEMYDSLSNKWVEIPKLPGDFGIACSGVVCNGVFLVYSETDKLAGYDVERDYWFGIDTATSPSRVLEYYPKLVSCDGRVFMLSVSWCDEDGEVGRRNKAIRKMWELDLADLTWTEVSIHPDAPMDWNATFVANKNVVFGVEMFKIFGQVLDFFTACDVTDQVTQWSHISTNCLARKLDASSCMTKTMAVLHL